MTNPTDVLNFWFSAEPRLWFTKNDGFDAAIREQFEEAMEDARAGELSAWETELQGLLALIILLDQFSRNLYRGSGDAFKHDGKALALSHKLVVHPDFDSLSVLEKQFGVMPMMHAEDIEQQKTCLIWMERIGNQGAIDAAHTHMDIIERFGRFPHRNGVLGRQSTPQEIAFLEAGGFSG